MKRREILDLWRTDAKMDDLNLDQTSMEVPNLHSKYLTMLSDARTRKRDSDSIKKRLVADLTIYYAGNADDALLRKLDREQFQERLKPREVAARVSKDPAILTSEEAVIELDECIEVLKEIMESVKWRHQNVKNAISWRQLMLGA